MICKYKRMFLKGTDSDCEYADGFRHGECATCWYREKYADLMMDAMIQEHNMLVEEQENERD